MTVLSQNSFAGLFSSKKSAKKIPLLQTLLRKTPDCPALLDPQLELDLQSSAGLIPNGDQSWVDVSDRVQSLSEVFTKFNPKKPAKFYESLEATILATPNISANLQRLIGQIANVERSFNNLRSQARVSGPDWTPERLVHAGKSIVVLTIATEVLRIPENRKFRDKIAFPAMKFADPRGDWNSLQRAPVNGDLELLTKEIGVLQNELRTYLSKRIVVREELEGLISVLLGTTPSTFLLLPKVQYVPANSMFVLVESLYRPDHGLEPTPEEILSFLKREVPRLKPFVELQDREGLVSELSNLSESLRKWNGKINGRLARNVDLQRATLVAGFASAAAKAIHEAEPVPWQALTMLFDRELDAN